MISRETITEQLRQIYADLCLLEDDFFVIGASAMILSGLDIDTSDVDLFTSDRDADLLQTLWAERIVTRYTPPDDHLFRSNFSRFDFGKIKIEVMGGLEINKNGVWTPLKIQSYYTFSSEINIKIPTVAEQRRILKLFGRPKDMERMRLLELLR